MYNMCSVNDCQIYEWRDGMMRDSTDHLRMMGIHWGKIPGRGRP